MYTQTSTSNQADNPTEESNNYLAQFGNYGYENEEQFIELLDNRKENGERYGNYFGRNKYDIVDQDTISNQKRNKKIKQFKINKPFLVEKPFLLDGSSFKTNAIAYNPLTDDHLRGFFLNKNVRKQIKQNQLLYCLLLIINMIHIIQQVDKEGKILDKNYVKINSSKDSQCNPTNNMALSFQINIPNESTHKGEINNMLSGRNTECINKNQKNFQHQKNDMIIETLCEDNEIKQDQLKSCGSPNDRRKVKEQQQSQKLLIQQNIYQQTYLSGFISDRINPITSRTNTKSACSGYSGATSHNFKNDNIKCKTPDPYSQKQQASFTNHATPNKTIYEKNEKTNSNQLIGVSGNIEERKKILQERKQLVKRQQLEMAKEQALQLQIKLAKQKELQQQKLLLIQKQEEQIKNYKLLMSNSSAKINENLIEKSPQGNILSNNSNVSNYLSKSPIIPTKLPTGKRPKPTIYNITDTYKQYDKQLMSNTKRCISVESNNINTSDISNYPNVINAWSENQDNQTILQKLNQNMIQIQNLQLKSKQNKYITPQTSDTKENTQIFDKKIDNLSSERPYIKNSKFSATSTRFSAGPTKYKNNQTRYNQKGSPNFHSQWQSQTQNLEDYASNRKYLPPSSATVKARVSPFTPGKREYQTPNRLQTYSQYPKSTLTTIDVNEQNIELFPNENQNEIQNKDQNENQQNEIQTNRNKEQQKDNQNDDETKVEKQNEQQEENNQTEEEEDKNNQFKEYMTQQVNNQTQDNQNIKQMSNTDSTNQQVSKQQFDSFLKQYKERINSSIHTNA